MIRWSDRGVIPALDGLRGIAIILVLLHHFTYYRPTSGIDAQVAGVLFFFWTGVDLFFVLSGFLITGILLDSRNSEQYFTSFYARRTLRIFPLYYLTLLVAFVVLPNYPAVHAVLLGREQPVTLPPQWPYWLYLTNFSIAGGGWVHGWVDVAWSLAIEEQFYLVWPLLIWLCPPRLVAWLCAVILVAEPAARVYARATGVAELSVFVLPWFRLDGFAIGALLAIAQRRGLLPSLDRWSPIVAAVAVGGIIGCAILGGHTWWWNRWMQQYGYSLIAITGGAMLVSGITRPAGSLWPRMLSAGWLRAFGKYSYGLYLIHPPVMRAVREYVFDPLQYERFGLGPWVAQVLYYVAATAPSFALAWLSWRFFESPILRLKRRFPYGRRGSSADAGPVATHAASPVDDGSTAIQSRA
jgi:peptidoglycan/LPS O-acetylase OafA/YrhL